ncbi:MAG: hypothetical protein WA001_03650 [Patescibacteria group bacterium]
MDLQPMTQKTLQNQVREAFRALLSKPGPLTTATLLTELGNQLHAACKFSGILRSSHDLDKLSDEQAKAALRIIPTLHASSAGADAFVRNALRKKPDSSSG